MPYLVRKITLAKWPTKGQAFKIDELNADTITAELRTKTNQLSWWIAETKEDVERIGVSFISKLESKVGNIKLVMIPLELFQEFEVKNTPQNGDTAVMDMRVLHYDVSNLTYRSLGGIAALIAKTTSEYPDRIITVKVQPAIESLKKMKSDGLLDISVLGKYIKEKLEIKLEVS